MARIESWQDLRQRARRFRQALAHWGPWHYLRLAALWIGLSLPMLIKGYGALSFASPLLFIAIVGILTWAIATPLNRWISRPVHAYGTDRMVPEFVHATLGTLVLDRRTAVYERPLTWKGRPSTLQLTHLDDACLASAVQLLARQRALEQEVDGFIVAQLMPTVIELARDCGWVVPTNESFLATITPLGLTVEADGSWDMMFHDEGLAGDHGLSVYGDAQGSLVEAQLHL